MAWLALAIMAHLLRTHSHWSVGLFKALWTHSPCWAENRPVPTTNNTSHPYRGCVTGDKIVPSSSRTRKLQLGVDSSHRQGGTEGGADLLPEYTMRGRRGQISQGQPGRDDQGGSAFTGTLWDGKCPPGHSYRRASIGSSFAAAIAGYRPEMMPTKTESPKLSSTDHRLDNRLPLSPTTEQM